MKFLKAFLNGLLSGLFFSVLLTLLILDININLPFQYSSAARLLLFSAATYGVLILVLSLLVFFAVQFFLGKKFAIRPLSPSFLSLSFSLSTLLFLVVFRLNFSYFLSFFDTAVQELLSYQMAILLGTAILGPSAFYLSRRGWRKPLVFLPYFLLLAGALVSVYYIRTLFPPQRQSVAKGQLLYKEVNKKISLLGLEGLSLDFILPLVGQGKLPNFSWLVENGSWGRLGTFTPSDSPILDISLVTGKMPHKHRVLSPVRYSILYPDLVVDVVPRYIFFRQLAGTGLLRVLPKPPQDLERGGRPLWRLIQDYGVTVLRRDGAKGPCGEIPSPRAEKSLDLLFAGKPLGRGPLAALAKKSMFCDFDTEEQAFIQRTQEQPGFFKLLLWGLPPVQASFYKYNFPQLFGSIAQEEINLYGSVIEKYYEFYDQIIGKYLTGLKEDEILMVYSPYGVEPLPLWKRFVEWILGNAEMSASHEEAPDGVIFLLGKGIEKGKTIEGMKVVDIAPTLLYCIGLPVGKDMDGSIRSSIFVPEFTVENPARLISSYDDYVVVRPSK